MYSIGSISCSIQKASGGLQPIYSIGTLYAEQAATPAGVPCISLTGRVPLAANQAITSRSQPGNNGTSTHLPTFRLSIVLFCSVWLRGRPTETQNSQLLHFPYRWHTHGYPCWSAAWVAHPRPPFPLPCFARKKKKMGFDPCLSSLVTRRSLPPTPPSPLVLSGPVLFAPLVAMPGIKMRVLQAVTILILPFSFIHTSTLALNVHTSTLQSISFA